MLNCDTLRAMALTLPVAISVVGAISVCHSNTIAQTYPSAMWVAENAYASGGLTTAGVTPTPPLDETPITPR